MEGVSKRYGGVRALENASLSVAAGRIHAILGENGAGKSTLIKIMAGVVTPDDGRMMLDGAEVAFASPAAANRAGIVCIFQELSLIPDLSVADNIVISNPPKRFGLIDRRAQRRIAEEALARAGATTSIRMALVKDLPLSRRQMVEIAKALAREPRILILDEATSALTAADVAKVFVVLKRLRDEGLALLYISHRMHEIAELADECTVFRNGRNVATYRRRDQDRRRSRRDDDRPRIQSCLPAEAAAARRRRGPPLLEVADLSWADRLHDISFHARAGEVVGLGGLDGQGQRELLLALFGVLRGVSGEIRVAGRVGLSFEPACGQIAAGRHGADPRGPQDRGADAADVGQREPLLRRARPPVARRNHRPRPRGTAVAEMIDLLAIRSGRADIPAGALSGGNQQKVVIAKWLMAEPRIILLNDPTRGIDVGTKQEIYQLLRRLADAGAAIVFYSTDYAELIGCCDRVLVLYDGAIRRVLVGDEITERALIAARSTSPTSRRRRLQRGGANERLALCPRPEPRRRWSRSPSSS